MWVDCSGNWERAIELVIPSAVDDSMRKSHYPEEFMALHVHANGYQQEVSNRSLTITLREIENVSKEPHLCLHGLNGIKGPRVLFDTLGAQELLSMSMKIPLIVARS